MWRSNCIFLSINHSNLIFNCATIILGKHKNKHSSHHVNKQMHQGDHTTTSESIQSHSCDDVLQTHTKTTKKQDRDACFYIQKHDITRPTAEKSHAFNTWHGSCVGGKEDFNVCTTMQCATKMPSGKIVPKCGKTNNVKVIKSWRSTDLGTHSRVRDREYLVEYQILF